MKLEFSLLVVDDDPGGLNQAVKTLEEHLESKGFSLISNYFSKPSEEGLRELERGKGKNYDLVLIDYNLDDESIDGTEVARRLRLNLPYTDMVFYSGVPAKDLHKELAKHGISGVHVEERRNLGEPLVGIADTVIGKAVDLNHMRGIAMAEVAEMDVMMQEVLTFVLESKNPKATQVDRRTKRKLVESMEGRLADLKGKLSQGLIPVVLDNNLFSSYDRYRAIVRAMKAIRTNLNKENEVLQSYTKDIIDNRNLLAHAKEETGNNNQAVLRSTKQGEVIVIDEVWMQEFRKKLRTHRLALEAVCEALQKEFGPSHLSQD